MALAAQEFFHLRVRWHGLVVAATSVTATTCTLGLFGRFHWLLDLFSHFRVQYAGILLLCAATLWLMRKPRMAVVGAIFCLLNVATIAPYYFPKTPPKEAETLELLQLNVNTHDGIPSKVMELIRRNRPDIVVLEEIDQRWFTALSLIERSFPYRVTRSRADNFGIAVYSRHPLQNTEVLYLGSALVPTISTQVLTPGGPLWILAVHTLPPIGPELARMRDDHLRQLARTVKTYRGAVILVGDLNATHWSYHFQRLVHDSGLTDCAQGLGIHATWHAVSPWLRIPIDHCLYSAQVTISQIHSGPDVGSDHLPLIVGLSLKESRQIAAARH